MWMHVLGGLYNLCIKVLLLNFILFMLTCSSYITGMAKQSILGNFKVDTRLIELIILVDIVTNIFQIDLLV